MSSPEAKNGMKNKARQASGRYAAADAAPGKSGIVEKNQKSPIDINREQGDL